LIEDYVSNYTETEANTSVLKGKKIVYDGDSIAMGLFGDGGYAQMISDLTDSKMVNFATGGGCIVSLKEGQKYHSVVDNLVNLPTDGDLYCFQAGINDYWTYGNLGAYDPNDFDGPLDKTTVCGALEWIFRYMKENDKTVVFIISHKIQHTADHENAMGDTFGDYHDAMVGICEKYGVTYYDAFFDSGLDGSNNEQNNLYLTGNSEGKADGTHPNADGYKKFYVPQLIAIFEGLLK
jgi:lysophospholipase L1-like esterase